MTPADLAPYAGFVLQDATFPDLPNHSRGKVRDNYDLPDGRRILVASDRLSAFDRALAAIPLKGQVLTQTARFWFEATADLCPNHVIAHPDPNVLVGRRLAILPVEVVVRGYLAGTTATSILTQYREGRRTMYGHTFPDGLRPNERLAAPILTPTTKADAGGHDEPLSGAEILARGLLTGAQWAEVSRLALALFARGQAMAEARGLILADTKYEFGLDPDGRIVLADEVHTPDSSRYWFARSYPERLARGEAPDSFDKDRVRHWVTARCDPYREPVPPIPEAVVMDTAAVYVRAYETITGARLALPDPREDPRGRIARNLRAYLGGAPA